MAIQPAVFSRADDFILSDATVSGSASLDTYDPQDLIIRNPAMRVRYGSGSITVTWTLPSPRQADVFALPVSNLTVNPTLSNGSGLSQVITIPAIPVDGIPLGPVNDLRIGTPSAVTRTSDSWTLTISANPADVILGAGIWLGTLRSFDKNFKIAPKRTIQHYGVKHRNDYGTDYRQNHETKTEQLMVNYAFATDADRQKLEDWYKASAGAYGEPSLFWMDPSINNAVLGMWQETYSEIIGESGADNRNEVPIVFDILSKGKPVV